MKSVSVAVIGAGLSGLSCARALSAAGVEVTVFEKSRSLGGRCATRKWEGHIVDHGAQFFTIRNSCFQAELNHLAPDCLRAIEAPVLDPRDCEVSPESTRWYHRQGNNRLGKNLLGDLRVTMETEVGPLEKANEQWQVGGLPFDVVVISAPLPQAFAILGFEKPSGVFSPCLTAFFSYDGDWAGDSRQCYARVDRGGPLEWSACENHKAGRITAGQTVFVAQASAEFSSAHLEAIPREWAAALQEMLESRWKLRAADRMASFTHRWRFARSVSPIAIPPLPSGVHLTGDGLTESRVESAWLAGRATAQNVLAEISNRSLSFPSC